MLCAGILSIGALADSDFTVTKGENSYWVQNSHMSLSFTVVNNNYPGEAYLYFRTVYIDGLELASSDYDIINGDDVFRIKSSYLDTLSPGTYDITFAFGFQDFVTSYFTVVVEDRLGDANNNGRVTPADAALVLGNPAACVKELADVDHSFHVNEVDAFWILKHSIGLSGYPKG